MEPRLRYASTADGVSIAYFVAGRGPPIVFASNIWGDANMYAAPHPHTRYMTDTLLSLGWQVVRYDIRGMGASQREVTDFSLDARVLDLIAVVEHAGLARFAVAGVDGAAGVAIAFAATHPEHVSHVIALNAWPVGGVRYGLKPISRLLDTMYSVADKDWGFFTTALAKLVTELDDPQHTETLAALFRRSATPQIHNAVERATAEFDIRPFLGLLQMPVLVVHDTGFPFGSYELAQAVASRVPTASLVIVQGERDAEIAAIDAFLRLSVESLAGPAQDRAPARRALLTPRETEILKLIAAGRTNREISEELVLSVRTVARHITNIYAKIGARSKAEATAYAFRQGPA